MLTLIAGIWAVAGGARRGLVRRAATRCAPDGRPVIPGMVVYIQVAWVLHAALGPSKPPDPSG